MRGMDGGRKRKSNSSLTRCLSSVRGKELGAEMDLEEARWNAWARSKGERRLKMIYHHLCHENDEGDVVAALYGAAPEPTSASAQAVQSEEKEKIPDRIHKEEMSVDKVMAAMDEYGYCIVEDFFSAEKAQAIKNDLEPYLIYKGRTTFEGFKTNRIYALFAKTREFDEFATDPTVLEVVEKSLGIPNFSLSAPVGIHIGPGEVDQALHRDSGKYPVPRLNFPEVIVNTMWALDDFTEENGATRIVPGSHRWDNKKDIHRLWDGAIDPRDIDPSLITKATMRKGSMMFYRGNLFHGGGANTTDKPRFGVIIEYVAGWLRPQENHVLAVPQDTVRKLSPRLQELLGYDVIPPFIGYVDGRHPRRILDKDLPNSRD